MVRSMTRAPRISWSVGLYHGSSCIHTPNHHHDACRPCFPPAQNAHVAFTSGGHPRDLSICKLLLLVVHRQRKECVGVCAVSRRHHRRQHHSVAMPVPSAVAHAAVRAYVRAQALCACVCECVYTCECTCVRVYGAQKHEQERRTWQARLHPRVWRAAQFPVRACGHPLRRHRSRQLIGGRLCFGKLKTVQRHSQRHACIVWCVWGEVTPTMALMAAKSDGGQSGEAPGTKHCHACVCRVLHTHKDVKQRSTLSVVNPQAALCTNATTRGEFHWHTQASKTFIVLFFVALFCECSRAPVFGSQWRKH